MALLDALEELKKHKIAIRGIHPSNIVFSEDYSLVMFAIVENACMELEKDEVKNQQLSLYNTPLVKECVLFSNLKLLRI